MDIDRFTMAEVESNAVRCPDADAAEKMYGGELHLNNFAETLQIPTLHAPRQMT